MRRSLRKNHVGGVLVRTGAALLAPLAWAADRVLLPSVVHHPIAAPRSVFVSRSAGRVSRYEAGPPVGTPLVLLHDLGPTATAYELRPLFEAFRHERPVIAPDMPGYGFSERRAEPWARDTYVAFVCELIAETASRHGTAVDVVAVGSAAPIAVRAVSPSSRLVRSLALVGARDMHEPRWIASAAKSRLYSVGVVGALVHRVATSRPLLALSLARRAARIDREIVSQAHEAARRPGARHAHLSAMSGALACDARATLRALKIPVHEILGGMPHVERPEETIAALRAFYGALSPKPRLRIIRGEGRLTPRRESSLKRAT